jgi:hypothetical protein
MHAFENTVTSTRGALEVTMLQDSLGIVYSRNF